MHTLPLNLKFTFMSCVHCGWYRCNLSWSLRRGTTYRMHRGWLYMVFVRHFFDERDNYTTQIRKVEWPDVLDSEVFSDPPREVTSFTILSWGRNWRLCHAYVDYKEGDFTEMNKNLADGMLCIFFRTFNRRYESIVTIDIDDMRSHNIVG